MKRWTMFNYPYPRASLFSRWAGIAKGFNFSTFLDGTQKTLGVINQAIPIVYQVKPIFNNAKTMFKIADELRRPATVEDTTNTDSVTSTAVQTEATNKPIFYI